MCAHAQLCTCLHRKWRCAYCHHLFAGSHANPRTAAQPQGQGLNEKQMRLCDSFVYIPQHGAGTASLNVTVAASIILHHFALWAGYPERGREGAKFAVGERPLRIAGRGEGGGGRAAGVRCAVGGLP